MSKLLSKLYVHAIFHVKTTSSMIRPEDEKRLYSYINGLIILNESSPIIVNGIENHVHVLYLMSKNISTAVLMEEILLYSSKWIKSLGAFYSDFAWQSEYSCYSVSKSRVNDVYKFIDGQKELHKTLTFEEEYRQFLNENEVNFQEEYLWS